MRRPCAKAKELLEALKNDQLLEKYGELAKKKLGQEAADALFKKVNGWIIGFTKSKAWAAQVMKLFPDAKKKDIRQIVQVMMGDPDAFDRMTPAAKKLLEQFKKSLDWNLAKKLADETLELAKKMKVVGCFFGILAIASTANAAVEGATGQGPHSELTGLTGALDAIAYDAMMAALIESYAREMSQFAASVMLKYNNPHKQWFKQGVSPDGLLPPPPREGLGFAPEKH